MFLNYALTKKEWYYIQKYVETAFKLVDSAISATPFADRCIKSSTHKCNLHRQALAIEWPYWKAQWRSTWHLHGCHLSNKSVHQISALIEMPRSTVSAVIVKWKGLGATTAQQQSGRPHKLTERDRWVLKCAACKNCLSSVATLTTEFQTASGSKMSAKELVIGSFMKWVSMAEQA